MQIDVVKQQIGKRIKMIRMAAGLKQKDLAAELGISPPLLSMYERGDREQSINFLCIFATFFHLTLSQFFSLVEEEQQQEVSPEVATLMKEFRELVVTLEKKTLRATSEK